MNTKENFQFPGQITIDEILNPASWFGKTSQVPSVPTAAKTSAQFLKKPQGSRKATFAFLNLTENGPTPAPYWEMVGHLPGEHMTRNFGEYPNEEKGSRLSLILEETPPPRFCLSVKACQGILNRAKKRNKVLPEVLRLALEATIRKAEGKTTEAPPMTSKETISFQERAGKPGGGKGILIQNERTGSLSTTNRQAVCTNGNEKAVFDASRRNNNYKPFGDVCGTVQAFFGTDGNNVPVVLEGNGARPSHHGDGYAQSEVSFSLNTIERHGVAYGLDAYNQSMTGNQAMTMSGAASDPHHVPCVVGYSQDAYDKYTQTDVAATLKQSGGNFGGGYRNPNQTIGALCARDYKGVGSQYVDEGKIIIQEKEDE